MSFGNQTSAKSDPVDNRSGVVRPRKKFPWLRGGVLCMALGVVNVVYFSQTGKIFSWATHARSNTDLRSCDEHPGIRFWGRLPRHSFLPEQ
jgi:hypothetical protein